MKELLGQYGNTTEGKNRLQDRWESAWRLCTVVSIKCNDEIRIMIKILIMRIFHAKDLRKMRKRFRNT